MKQPELAQSPEALSGERESTRENPKRGELIDERYRVLELLGSGGMADVYEVEHVRLGRRFALKLLRDELARDSELKLRFEREARAVAKLTSEHIVAIVDSGSTPQGAAYFVMERLHGRELRQLLQAEGALPLQRALHIALGVCRALEVAHRAGVIHRDLKPENLFLVPTADGREQCKVLDFGVAKVTGENPTMPGTLMGTARYMAPEQIAGSSAVSPATDVFALGVILFECLVGTPPFSGDTLERVLYRIVSEATPSLLELRPELPPELAALLERLLAKAPAERPQSAREVADALSVFTLGGRVLSDETANTLLEAARAPQLGAHARKPAAPRAPWWKTPLSFALGLAAGLALSFARPQATNMTAPTPTPSTASTHSATAAAPAPQPPALPVNAAEPPSVEAGKPSASSARPLAPVTVQRPAGHASAVTSEAAPAPKPPLFYPQDSKP